MLTILHTNDLHCAVGMLPRLTALIQRERARNPGALLVDAGDLALGGRAADLGVELLSPLGYAALITGNAENDVREHRLHLPRLNAPVIVANVDAAAWDFPVEPWRLFECGGARVGLLGLTAPPPYPAGHPLHRPNAQEIPVADAWHSAQEWVPRLRREADLVVVLSHLGLTGDLRLARELPGIDLIVGGHSHHRLLRPLRAGDTHICQAGVNGAYLGVVTVTAAGNGPRVTGRLEPVWQELAADPAAERRVRRSLEQHWPEALEVVGSTSGCWGDPWSENPWSNWVTDTFRRWTGAEVCFYKSMALFPALDPGPVTRWDLLRCLPAAEWLQTVGLDHLVTMQLSGSAIRELCEHSVGELPGDLPAQGPATGCLPGNTLLHPSGMRLDVDLARSPGERVVHLSVAGRDVQPDRLYAVVTSGFLARGYSGFHWFRDGHAQQFAGQELEILVQHLRPGITLPPIDGRLHVAGG